MATNEQNTVWLVSWANAEWDADYGENLAEPKGEVWRDGEAGFADAKRQMAEWLAENDDAVALRWEDDNRPDCLWSVAFRPDGSVEGWAVARKTEVR